MTGLWCYPGGPHLLTPVVDRSWRNWWRRRISLRCFECDFRQDEPS